MSLLCTEGEVPRHQQRAALYAVLESAIEQFGHEAREYRVWFKSNGFAVVDVYTDDDVQVTLAQVRSNDDGSPYILRF